MKSNETTEQENGCRAAAESAELYALLAVKMSVGNGVVKSVVKILELIAQYPDVTRERLAKEVGLSVRGVEKNLAQLKSEGKIVRVGGRKGGHWEVVKRKGDSHF